MKKLIDFTQDNLSEQKEKYESFLDSVGEVEKASNISSKEEIKREIKEEIQQEIEENSNIEEEKIKDDFAPKESKMKNFWNKLN